MATPFPRTAFKALLASILNLPVTYVTWAGDKEPAFAPPQAPLLWASLRISPTKRDAVGWDDRRQIDNADGSMTVQQFGRRQITLSLELFTWFSTDIGTADDILEALFALAWSPDNLATLNGMQLVMENCGPIITLPTTINGRWISAAHMDLTVALATVTQVRYPGGNGYINEVTGTGTFTGEETATPSVDVKSSKNPLT